MVATSQNNIPEQEGDVAAAVEVTDERPYLADNYNLVFSSDTFDPINISVPFTGDASKTAEAIAKAISSDETLNQSISVLVTGADLTFRANEQGFDFTVQLAELDGLQDLHNQENNQTKLATIPEFQPTSNRNQTADVGVATVVSLENLPNTATEFSFYGENNLLIDTVDFQPIDGQDSVVTLAALINNNPNLNGIIEATPEDNTLVISGLDGGSDFTNVSWDDNGNTITGIVVTDGIKPIKQIDQISNLNGLEQTRSEILSFLPAQIDENASTFEVLVNGLKRI